jgi:hypothetical protein
MASRAEEETQPVVDVEGEQRRLKVRRFAAWMTVLMILLCNTVFLLGIWGSGVNLDGLIRFPEIFNPKQDVCLRLTWHKVAGLEEPVRLCSEWIQLSDPSGQTHQFQKDTKVVQGADGKLYFDHGVRVDYHLFLFVAFVAAVVISGIVLKKYLIARYRLRLEMAGNRASLHLH